MVRSDRPEDVLPVREAAAQAGTSRRTVERLIAAGALPVYKYPLDRMTYVSLSQLREALAQQPPSKGRPRRWRTDAPDAQGPPPA